MRRRYVLLAITSILAIALTVPALGGPGNPIATGAASAKKTAKKALKKAKKAQKAANVAQDTADGAQTSANQAQTSANQAQTSADQAQTTADGAQTAAENAQTTADAAGTAAAAAQTSADAAQATADSKFGDTDQNSGDVSATDSTSPKVASEGCDSGYEPTGGGWIINGAGSNDVVVNLTTAYGTGWIVQATEIGGGTADTWSLQANIKCVGPTP